MPVERQSAAERHLRVLLVEGDDANREIESLMLRHLGHAVDAVADGAAALTALAAARYDAILMDCHMPVMDGFAASASIRAASADEHIPIIGLARRDELPFRVEAGMDDHLAKPFAIGELAAALERATPTAATPFAGVLDPEIVDQLRMLARSGSPELLDSVASSFARDTPVRVAALRTAIASADRDAIAFNAHTLKGSAANLGAIAIVAVCQELESALELAPADRLLQLLPALEQAAADAEAALAALARAG
jgi:CheY-like chemotaxis protein/HPt (histidine-containing phosphotransfer) domain-containing protein